VIGSSDYKLWDDGYTRGRKGKKEKSKSFRFVLESPPSILARNRSHVECGALLSEPLLDSPSSVDRAHRGAARSTRP